MGDIVENTFLLTDKGFIDVKNIHPSHDKIISVEGCFEHIKKITEEVYEGNLYNIKLFHFPKIKCNINQKFYTKKEKTYEWKSVNNIDEDSYICMLQNDKYIIPNFKVNTYNNCDELIYFSLDLDKKEYWYMLGYFFSNNSYLDIDFINSEYKIFFNIKNKDLDYIKNKFDKIFNTKGIKIEYDKDNTDLVYSSFIWYKILEDLKIVPEWIQNAPKIFIYSFLTGYKDAEKMFCNLSYQKCIGIQRLYLKIGLVFNINHNTIGDYYLSLEENDKVIFDKKFIWCPVKKIKKKLSKFKIYKIELEKSTVCIENCIIQN